jgi:hypothetical protein
VKLSFKASQSREYTPISEGTHIVIFSGIVDLGPQLPPPGPFPKPPTHQLCLIHEFPNERIDVDGVSKPARKYTILTASMNSKAQLRKWIESLVGKLNDELAEQFNVFDLVGRACLATIQHKEGKNGKVFDNIVSVSPLMKGMEPPKMESDPIIYGGDAIDSFNALPQWLQGKITAQLAPEDYEARRKQFYEGQKAAQAAKAPAAGTLAVAADAGDFSDDIPF